MSYISFIQTKIINEYLIVLTPILSILVKPTKLLRVTEIAAREYDARTSVVVRGSFW